MSENELVSPGLLHLTLGAYSLSFITIVGGPPCTYTIYIHPTGPTGSQRHPRRSLERPTAEFLETMPLELKQQALNQSCSVNLLSTPPESTNVSTNPKKTGGLGRCFLLFQGGVFSGSMLVFGRVTAVKVDLIFFAWENLIEYLTLMILVGKNMLFSDGLKFLKCKLQTQPFSTLHDSKKAHVWCVLLDDFFPRLAQETKIPVRNQKLRPTAGSIVSSCR